MTPPAPTLWFERHPSLATTLVAAVGIVVLIAAVEFTLRLTAPPPLRTVGDRTVRLREVPPLTDEVVRASPVQIARADGLTDRAVRFRTDADGFILPSVVHDDPDVTVAFFGGSTTECRFVREDARFHGVVAERLEAQTGARVNALNASMSGNHSLHSTIALVSKVAPYAPDVVVLMHNVNDLTTFLREGDYWNDNTSRRVVLPGPCLAPSCRIASGAEGLETLLFAAIRDRFRRATYRERPVLPEFDAPSVLRDSTEISRLFKASLRSFVEAARSFGSVPVLMTQANRFTERQDPALVWVLTSDEVGYEEYRDLYVAFNGHIRDLAAELDVPLVDLAAAIPPEPEWIYDFVHLTDAGSRRAAAEITDVLTERVLNERGRARAPSGAE